MRTLSSVRLFNKFLHTKDKDQLLEATFPATAHLSTRCMKGVIKNRASALTSHQRTSSRKLNVFPSRSLSGDKHNQSSKSSVRTIVHVPEIASAIFREPISKYFL
jgi:ribosomal protein S20